MKHFYQVLLNTLIANVTTSYLWFALTFWVYLETKSVLATGIIGGLYMLLVAVFSIIFGTIVDHNKKKNVMVFSSVFTFACFVAAGLLYLVFPKEQLVDWSGVIFWIFAGIILIGGVIENMRNIALSTTVTLLVPKDDHDKANGMVGTVQGVAFMVTSVFSGLSIGLLGMGEFDSEFRPDLTPQQMLELGVFGGAYFENEFAEFPSDWFKNATISNEYDKSLNYFGVKASQSREEWLRKDWIHEQDPRGWFQWYCRYYLGRRSEDDARQIKRWKNMKRHISQVQNACQPGDELCRPVQRQALLHWAYDSRKI